MHCKRFIYILTLLAGIHSPASAQSTPEDTHLDGLSLSELQNRRESIDVELAQTARFTVRSGAGSIGWFSTSGNNPNRQEWAEIQLDSNTPIDRIVLVPVLWNDAEKGPQADGFPEAFEIIAGTEGDTEEYVIARFGPEDRLLPRMAPLVIDFPPTMASWIRVQSTRLSTSANDEMYTFALSEIMVFNGERNVALSRPVRISSQTDSWGGLAITKQTLTDGFTPFLMDAGHGEKSKRFLARFSAKKQFFFTIDLGEIVPIDGIRLHAAADIRKHIPLPQQIYYGLPKHFEIKGANSSDFAKAVTLLDYKNNSIYDTGPILVRNVPETRCRYIRFSVPEPYQAPNMPADKRYVNLSELEIISNGRNVAKGKNIIFPRRGIQHEFMESITDGCNSFGTILSTREWMEQLARRHKLERERPVVAAALNHRYARQKKHLTLMYQVAALLAVAIGISFLLERMFHRLQLEKMRTRFAADLHDELGANLHVIGLLGDLAQAAVHSPDKLNSLHQRIRTMTERSGTAVRECTDMLQGENLYGDLLEDMQRTTQRIMADFDHTFTCQGEEYLQRLPPRRRADLFLFYKECLVNISRHSNATKCTTELTATPKEIRLTITDNGQGLEQSTNVPNSLKRRARLLKARVTSDCPAEGGTCICLTLYPQYGWLQKKLNPRILNRKYPNSNSTP
jgi:signal transduction histidine kinase